MNNAVLYPRYSSTGQNEQSIEGQIRVCSEFAERQGLNIIRIYDKDKAKSASKDTDKRKDLHRMFADAETGAFQYIIVYTMDRFARNRAESVLFKSQLSKLGVKVLSATEPIADDEGGELYEMFLEWNAEKYSQRLSKRVKDGLTTAVENGTYTGQKLNYGYKLVDTDKRGNKGIIHKVEIDEEQADIVRYVFTEYAKGTDKKVIADSLNAQNLKCNGKPFRHRTFENWLPNAKYTGEHYFGGRLVKNTFPQIIDPVLFDEVQKRLAKNKILAGANSAVEPYLLTGKAICGHCETAMIAGGGTGKSGKKHYYYVCKQKNKNQCDKKREEKNALELYVTENVRDFLSDPENVSIAADDTIKYYELRTGDDGMKSIETRIAAALKQVENYTNAFIEARNATLRAGIEQKMNEMETYLRDLRKQKGQLELERGKRITKQRILNYVAELLTGDPQDKAYQKKLIDGLVTQVIIEDGGSIVTYLNLRKGKEVARISLQNTKNAVSSVLSVQTLSSMVHQTRIKRTLTKIQSSFCFSQENIRGC